MEHRPGGLRGLLLPDHNDRLELMIDEVLLHWETSAGRGPFPVWERLAAELEEHLQVEERWILPALEVAHPREVATSRSLHAQLRALVTKVGNELALRSRTAPSLIALQKLQRAHAHHEDVLLHPWAVQNLDAEGWKAVRTAMRLLMFNVSGNHEHEREEP